jgi:acetoin utilization protein AcuB
MIVKDRMTPNPYFISPDASVSEALKLTKQHNIRRLPVVDRGKLMAIITKTDLYHASPASTDDYSPHVQHKYLEKTKIRAIIPDGQQLITVHQDANIEHAAKILADNKISGLPVVDNNEKLVGIISVIDILGAFLDIMGFNMPGCRVVLKLDKQLNPVKRVLDLLSGYQVTIHNITLLESRDNKDMLVLRMDIENYQTVLDNLKNSGFEVVSVMCNFSN